jgi:hypothetical protein
VTAFFIPGLAGDARVVEHAYTEMRAEVESDSGHRPSARRILQLWSRRGGVDCRTEVGMPDPIHGGTVLAIFDLGPKQPFIVHRRPDAGRPERIREVLSSHAYSVMEFET